MPTSFCPHVKAEAARAMGCRSCTHNKGVLMGAHVVCQHRAGTYVVGRPELGCAYWEREPGADDE